MAILLSKQQERKKMTRPLYNIAREIGETWEDITPYGVELVEAMSTLTNIEDTFFFDSGYRIVGCFLEESKRWKGGKEIKAELEAML